MNKITTVLIIGLILLTIPNMLYAVGGAAMSHAVSGDYGAVGIIIIIIFIIGLLIRAGVFQRIKENIEKDKKSEHINQNIMLKSIGVKICFGLSKKMDDVINLIIKANLNYKQTENLHDILTEENVDLHPLPIPKNKIGKVMKINGDELEIDKDVKILDTFRITGDDSTKVYIVTEIDDK